MHLQAAEREILLLVYISARVAFMVAAHEVKYRIIDQMLNMWDLKCQRVSSGVVLNKIPKSRGGEYGACKCLSRNKCRSCSQIISLVVQCGDVLVRELIRFKRFCQDQSQRIEVLSKFSIYFSDFWVQQSNYWKRSSYIIVKTTILFWNYFISQKYCRWLESHCMQPSYCHVCPVPVLAAQWK